MSTRVFSKGCFLVMLEKEGGFYYVTFKGGIPYARATKQSFVDFFRILTNALHGGKFVVERALFDDQKLLWSFDHLHALQRDEEKGIKTYGNGWALTPNVWKSSESAVESFSVDVNSLTGKIVLETLADSAKNSMFKQTHKDGFEKFVDAIGFYMALTQQIDKLNIHC